MLYLRAQELSQIQDAFNLNPLQDEKAIEKFYQDTTEARTGDAYLTCFGRCEIDLDSGDMEYTDVLFYILDLLINQANDNNLKISSHIVEKIERYWNSNTELTKTISVQGETEVSIGAETEFGIKKVIALLASVKAILKNSSELKKELDYLQKAVELMKENHMEDSEEAAYIL